MKKIPQLCFVVRHLTTNILRVGFLWSALLTGPVSPIIATPVVDSTFTRVTTGDIVTTAARQHGCAWGDFDNDEYPDLFIANGLFGDGEQLQQNFLYRNNRDGTFSRITEGAIVSELAVYLGCAWADFNDDGFNDIFVTVDGGGQLYRNEGNGTFTPIGVNVFWNRQEGGIGLGAAWSDYDKDGFIDLFVPTLGGSLGWANLLYRNHGSGNFTRVLESGVFDENLDSVHSAWADYDNDGYADLFVTNYSRDRNSLYRNNLTGSFIRDADTILGADDPSDSGGCAWGDYDNDGFLDLFVANGWGTDQKCFLYHNDGLAAGGRSFTKVTTGSLVTDEASWRECAWADYNNDGYLDIFVTAGNHQNNALHRNNGDGTFTRIFAGSLVNDGGVSWGCSWADYDRDGFLDLFVANGGPDRDEVGFLYRNDGNSNAWLSVKCVGTVSNRSAIGAKVRVKADIGGKTFWQLREINTGDGFSGTVLNAHFGLGDAPTVEMIRIEWPSGTVQELHDVAPRQFLTIAEPSRLTTVTTNGGFQFVLNGGLGFNYNIESSSNLLSWATLLNLTATNRAMQIRDPAAPNLDRRFYRARLSSPAF